MRKTSPLAPELLQAAEEQIIEQSKRIEFYLTEYTVELLAGKMRDHDFVVPAYQREYTWEDERKSRFLESVLMGLPIPFLFFWEIPETGKLEIVDGSQRLRTIEEFVLGDFRLGELEELSLLAGFRFSDLSESRQRKLKNRSIRGIVLNEHADDAARFDLFDRINTGSKVANKAEVRRGALPGEFLNLVISLATDPVFVDLAPVSDKLEKEREREELVLRFFAYGDGLEGYRDRVSQFLYTYLKRMNAQFKANPPEVQLYRDRFLRTMEFVRNAFPYGFRRTPTGTATPRARFEAIAIGSYLALMEHPNLTTDSEQVLHWLTGDDFAKVTGSDGANAVGRLRGRIEFVRGHLTHGR
jgi:uncharacterized protein with ParB-like and HNH nuclease domain